MEALDIGEVLFWAVGFFVLQVLWAAMIMRKM